MDEPHLLTDDRFRPLLTPGLDGWQMAGAGHFSWRDSGDGDPVLESAGGPGLLWYGTEVFGDAAVRIDWRTQDITDNSGVFLRCPPLGHDPSPAYEAAYEVQIDDRGVDNEGGRMDSPLHLTGAVYRLAPALAGTANPPGRWNRFDILARGGDLTVWLNGRQVSRLTGGERRTEGHLAIQNHHQGSRVQFRSIGVMPLPAEG